MSLRVIGAGFGRTGTASLKAALEQLGFSKCYHMTEVFARPDDVPGWQAAAAGEPVDWEGLFEGYQATVDWPGCTFYKELLAHYPDAQVILSVRDPESWYKSATDTIYKVQQRKFPMSLIPLVVPRLRRFIRMVRTVIWRNTFHDRFQDKAYALSVFDDHIAEVKRTVPRKSCWSSRSKRGGNRSAAFSRYLFRTHLFPG